jgi:hypothetical protein
MKYTIRFAHLKEKPKHKAGDTIKKGDIIGTMGSTGQSTDRHVHADCVEGEQKKPYKLAAIGTSLVSSKKQLDLFIDDELFGVQPFITTQYMDDKYKEQFGKDHPAYDIVPIDRHYCKDHFNLHWNRSINGKVSLIVDDPAGYGNCIYITFETKEKP